MKSKLIIICLLLQTACFAGYSVMTGKDYIIKPPNDTLFGRIELLSDIEFRNEVTFYDGEGKATSYKPGEISAFYIEEDNRYFEARDIQANDTTVKVFLRCLVKGEISLLLFRDYEEANIRYYYERGDYFAALYNTKGTRTINGKLYSVYNSEYITTLKKELVNICPGLLGSVDAVKYKEKELADFIEKLNKCISPTSRSATYLATNRTTVRTGIIAGAGFDKDWPAEGSSFGAGFFQEIKMPEISRHISLSYGLELGYGFTVKDELGNSWSYQKISVPVNINIEVTGLKVTPYFLGGVNFIHYLDLSNKSDEDPTEGITGGTVYPLSIGCGIKVKKLNFILITNVFDTRFKLAWYFK